MFNLGIGDSDKSTQKFELNPDHTHFILVDDEGVPSRLLEFRVALEKRFRQPLLTKRLKRVCTDNSDIVQEELKLSSEHSSNDAIPIVCLLIGGGVGSISLVQSKLMQCIPVLVFKGKLTTQTLAHAFILFSSIISTVRIRSSSRFDKSSL